MSEDIQPYEKSSRLTKSQIILNNFLGGISWALGATLGLGLIFTILGLIAKNVNIIPYFGTFVSQIIDFVLSHNPNLQR